MNKSERNKGLQASEEIEGAIYRRNPRILKNLSSLVFETKQEAIGSYL
ncbi:MAG: hypothetical protein AB7G87_12870 [Clostridia bacterium]